MLDKALNNSDPYDFYVGSGTELIKNTSVIQLPTFGKCVQVKDYDPHETIRIGHWNGVNMFTVYLTDPFYSTNYAIDMISNQGEKITCLGNGYGYIYKVNVEITYYKGNDDCSNELPNTYADCVEQEIEKYFLENNASCIPPWLTTDSKKACNKTITDEKMRSFFDGKRVMK